MYWTDGPCRQEVTFAVFASVANIVFRSLAWLCTLDSPDMWSVLLSLGVLQAAAVIASQLEPR